jgi:hypothetical protein
MALPRKSQSNGKPTTQRKATKPKRPTDVNQLGHYLVALSTGQIEAEEPKVSQSDISRVMAELGRRGGKIGGKNRAESMSPERRREIALKAARSRWDNKGSRN